MYIMSDRWGVEFVGPEGDEANTASVWHTEALIEELGIRAWVAVFSLFAW